eukprot:2953172-Rhodomonas_salina.1
MVSVAEVVAPVWWFYVQVFLAVAGWLWTITHWAAVHPAGSVMLATSSILAACLGPGVSRAP